MNSQEVAKITPDLAVKPSSGVVAEKWQGAVNEQSGFVAIPMALLRLQSSLKLSATDMVVLTNLLAHWWDADRGVFPRSTTIAKRMGVTKRTVQRSTQKLIDQGLVTRRVRGDGKREFQFTDLAGLLASKVTASLTIKSEESFDA